MITNILQINPLNQNILQQRDEIPFQDFQNFNNNIQLTPTPAIEYKNLQTENSLNFNNIFSQGDEPNNVLSSNIGPIVGNIHESIEPYVDNQLISKYSPAYLKSSLLSTELEPTNYQIPKNVGYGVTLQNQINDNAQYIQNIPIESQSPILTDTNTVYNPIQMPQPLETPVTQAIPPLQSALALINQDNPITNEIDQGEISLAPPITNINAEFVPQTQPMTMPPPPPPVVQKPESIIVKVPKIQQVIVPKVQRIVVPTKKTIYVRRQNGEAYIAEPTAPTFTGSLAISPTPNLNVQIPTQISQTIQVPISSPTQTITGQVPLLPSQMNMPVTASPTILPPPNPITSTVQVISSSVIPAQSAVPTLAPTPLIVPAPTQIQTALPTQVARIPQIPSSLPIITQPPLQLRLAPVVKPNSYNTFSQTNQYNSNSHPVLGQIPSIAPQENNLQNLPSATILTQMNPIQNNLPQQINQIQNRNILGNNYGIARPTMYKVSTLNRPLANRIISPSFQRFSTITNNLNNPLGYTTRTYNARRL